MLMVEAWCGYILPVNIPGSIFTVERVVVDRAGGTNYETFKNHTSILSVTGNEPCRREHKASRKYYGFASIRHGDVAYRRR